MAVNFVWAQQPAGTTGTARQNNNLVQAAQVFLQSLTPGQQQQAVFEFSDEERFNWHFVPRERKGLPLKEMDVRQRELAMALLQKTLSEQGYGKAKAIMELEVILKALENRPPDDTYRDPDKYYFSIFGNPTAQDPWGWRVEGHHLSLNFSSITGQVISQTPAFMGANPAIVPDGPAKGKQILKQEAALGFTLLHSFSAEQLKTVVIAEKAPNEIVTGNARKAMLEKPVGLRYPQMTPAQQKIFSQLLQLYLNNYQQDLARALRQKVEKAGMDNMYFAWAGSPEPGAGKPHYYRIHSPVILIEYDNSQNNANHVHTVIRDLTNDFGEDALKVHYQKHLHKK
ncbi:hypothetical protein AAE02nite_23740 [Adhaeribacter aerolatus]|uniref:DUF3500 domain-containing protein n=2 Tax=Adhaeribacter aerolatus TaxID=670289 RepID=A0A512AYD6_9BACT|nr:hypothetical protein AAE02nite_23740 [Adhaeribacter aerolatus]